MLTRIQIKNFALIKALDCSVGQGFTAITGASGSGKSLLVSAISLALGSRWQSRWYSEAVSETCHVSLHFNLADSPDASKWLQAQGLSSQDRSICTISREISVSGRSRHRVNGHDCSLKIIRELSPFLISFHGQHKQQRLLESGQPLFLVDVFAKTLPQRENVHSLYTQWHKAKEESKHLHTLLGAQEDKQALLEYQLEELNALDLQPDEWEALNQTHKKLSHASELMQDCQHVLDALQGEGEHSLLDTLHDGQHTIDKAVSLVPELANTSELLQQAQVCIKEACAELQAQALQIDADPEQLQTVERRLSHIYDIARKHKVPPYELSQRYEALRQELKEWELTKSKSEQLKAEIDHWRASYQKVSAELTQKRQAALPVFNEQITQHMQTLGMPHGVFSAQCLPYDDNEPHAYGNERLVFYAKTNLGGTLAPLDKIVSGGELSRLSLMIETVTQQEKNSSTLIFDEVDVGISGAIAEIVGRLLRKLGNTAQIVCITHLPQVAAQAHRHWCVEKTISQAETHVAVRDVTDKGRAHAVAELLGGVTITPDIVKQAEKMLADA